MEWALDHLQLIVFIAGVIAYWLNQRRREKAGEPADYDEDGIPENRPLVSQTQDPEEDERTRRIQEEIRRKIRERQAMSENPPPMVEPPTLFQEEVEEPQGGTAPQPAFDSGPSNEDLILRQQRELEEQYRALQERKTSFSVTAETPTTSGVQPASLLSQAPGSSMRPLSDDLRTPSALKRAFVLREVLGPPIGLR